MREELQLVHCVEPSNIYIHLSPNAGPFIWNAKLFRWSLKKTKKKTICAQSLQETFLFQAKLHKHPEQNCRPSFRHSLRQCLTFLVPRYIFLTFSRSIDTRFRAVTRKFPQTSLKRAMNEKNHGFVLSDNDKNQSCHVGSWEQPCQPIGWANGMRFVFSFMDDRTTFSLLKRFLVWAWPLVVFFFV